MTGFVHGISLLHDLQRHMLGAVRFLRRVVRAFSGSQSRQCSDIGHDTSYARSFHGVVSTQDQKPLRIRPFLYSPVAMSAPRGPELTGRMAIMAWLQWCYESRATAFPDANIGSCRDAPRTVPGTGSTWRRGSGTRVDGDAQSAPGGVCEDSRRGTLRVRVLVPAHRI